jgi:hypothetical protein
MLVTKLRLLLEFIGVAHKFSIMLHAGDTDGGIIRLPF